MRAARRPVRRIKATTVSPTITPITRLSTIVSWSSRLAKPVKFQSFARIDGFVVTSLYSQTDSLLSGIERFDPFYCRKIGLDSCAAHSSTLSRSSSHHPLQINAFFSIFWAHAVTHFARLSRNRSN